MYAIALMTDRARFVGVRRCGMAKRKRGHAGGLQA